jgi:NADPH:quinone reductase-like Zn-dependent oxidoreductase
MTSVGSRSSRGGRVPASTISCSIGACFISAGATGAAVGSSAAGALVGSSAAGALVGSSAAGAVVSSGAAFSVGVAAVQLAKSIEKIIKKASKVCNFLIIFSSR